MSKETIAIQGTPVEVGADIFNRICMPAVRTANARLQASPTQLTQLYSGFIVACLGSMAADFGQERAAHIAQVLTDSFRSTDLGGEASTH